MPSGRSTWAFIDAGRRIERAQLITRLLRNTLAIERPPIVDGQLTEAVLRACDSVITHRRRMAAGLGPATPIGSGSAVGGTSSPAEST